MNSRWLTAKGLTAIFADVATLPVNITHSVAAISAQAAPRAQAMAAIGLLFMHGMPLLLGYVGAQQTSNPALSGIIGTAIYFATHGVNAWIMKSSMKDAGISQEQSDAMGIPRLFPRMAAHQQQPG